MKISILAFCLISTYVNAEVRVYKTDSVGNTQYHKGSLSIQGDRIVTKDAVGNTQYHKEQYKIIENKIYKTDSIGNVQYHKGSVKVGK
jgi:hypothetical protein